MNGEVQETPALKKRGRAIPEGRTMTMAQQVEHYNGLVDQAIAKGVTAFKKHTSIFFTYEGGTNKIALVEKAISEA